MVPAGNKAKPLSLVNHTTKTIHRHHHIIIIIVIIKKTECCYIMEPLVVYIYMCRQIDQKIFKFELVYPLILSVPEK